MSTFSVIYTVLMSSVAMLENTKYNKVFVVLAGMVTPNVCYQV